MTTVTIKTMNSTAVAAPDKRPKPARAGCLQFPYRTGRSDDDSLLPIGFPCLSGGGIARSAGNLTAGLCNLKGDGRPACRRSRPRSRSAFDRCAAGSRRFRRRLGSLAG